ncbi:ATP-binding protein [Oscillatoria laete-virens NRMC-F 0139]|nr:ATP-binding protein [Oscillatoria laete-virens]MDL5053333.1 ATP-binding protein [Oscillatoria laete-virens NRMC-F 0139]
MSMLESVISGIEQKPPRLIVYGCEGVGKSTFAADAPDPIFIPTEDGVGRINCKRLPLVTHFDQLLNALVELYTAEHPYKTVVIDSLDWLERLVFDVVCKEFNVKSIEKADGGYARGYTHALNYWRKLIEGLDALRNERNMGVILIAHAKVERFEDPEAPVYDRYSPRIHKHASALLCEWSDAVLFATRKIRTQTEEAGFGRERTIAVSIGKDGGERVLRTVGGPSCVAKNRFGLPSEIPLTWSAFAAGL